MPIIINDFEITIDPPANNPPQPQAPLSSEPPQKLRPEDILHMVQHQRDRLARVRAD